MTDDSPHNDHLTADDLQKYRAGLLSAAEQHRVERLLLENPLYADALEGLEAVEPETTDLNRVSGELRDRLQNRIGARKTRRIPVWIPAAVASVVLVLSIGLYLRLQEKPQSDSMVSLPAPEISASKEAAPSVNPTAIPQPEPLPTIPSQPKRPVAARKTAPAPAKDSLIISRDNLTAASSTIIYSRKSEIPMPTSVVSVNPELSGQVTDETNQPLAGASIVAKNARRGSSTDSLGRFRLENVQKNDSLQIMSIGFETKTVRVADLQTGKIQLKQDTKALSEVVAVGYEKTQTKNEMPGSMAKRAFLKTDSPSIPANFKTYLEENRRMPPEAKEKGISGTVRVRFQVSVDGSVSQFSVVKSLGYGCDEEAIRLIREGPRWKPAFRNGKPFIQFVEQDIVF